MINAIVLAAGESRRMGMPKPLLRFEDTTFLGRIISVLRSSHVDRTSVILGAAAETIQASMDLSGVETVINRQWRDGQLSSLIAGLKSIPPETDAILVCLVDNPFVTTEVVNRIVRAFAETGSPIVVPVFDGRRGHPALFARAMFGRLLEAPLDRGARHVLQANADKVLEVAVDEPSILARIDAPDDYISYFGVAPQTVGGGNTARKHD